MLSWIGLVATPAAPAPGWCELLFLDVHSFRLSFFCSLLFGCCSFSDKCMSFIRHPSIYSFIHLLSVYLYAVVIITYNCFSRVSSIFSKFMPRKNKSWLLYDNCRKSSDLFGKSYRKCS